MIKALNPILRIAYRLEQDSKLYERKALKCRNKYLAAYYSGKSCGYFEASECVEKNKGFFGPMRNEISEMPCLVAGDLPAYAHDGDAGMDIRASENAIIHKGEYKVVHTGLHIECPGGHVAYVMPRSGLAVKHGITVLNAPGVVDSGYRGEIVVPLINLGRETFEVSPGDRIAQLIISPYTKVKPYSVSSLSDSERGSYGLGSTGVK